jgi:hypothetical protein
MSAWTVAVVHRAGIAAPLSSSELIRTSSRRRPTFASDFHRLGRGKSTVPNRWSGLLRCSNGSDTEHPNRAAETERDDSQHQVNREECRHALMPRPGILPNVLQEHWPDHPAPHSKANEEPRPPFRDHHTASIRYSFVLAGLSPQASGHDRGAPRGLFRQRPHGLGHPVQRGAGSGGRTSDWCARRTVTVPSANRKPPPSVTRTQPKTERPTTPSG